MIEQHLPVLLIAVPLIAAPLLILIGNRQLVQLLSLIVAWIVFAISLMMMGRVLATGAFEYQLGGWPSPYGIVYRCLLYTSPSPRDKRQSRMPSSA